MKRRQTTPGTAREQYTHHIATLMTFDKSEQTNSDQSDHTATPTVEPTPEK
jgi:hypothetical protein